MSQESPQNDYYLAQHVREILAKHPDVRELDIQVTVAGSKLVVAGNAQTPERRQAISDVLAEAFPDRQIVNETGVLGDVEAGADTEVIS